MAQRLLRLARNTMAFGLLFDRSAPGRAGTASMIYST